MSLIDSQKGGFCNCLFGLSLLASAAVSQAQTTALGAQAGGAGIKAGPGFIYPSVAFKTFYDDNLLDAETNELDTFGGVIAPYAAYEISDKTRRFVVDWLLEAGFYTDSNNDDYVDNTVRAEYAFQPTSRFYSALKGEFKDTRDPRGTGRAEGVSTVLQADPDEWHSFGVEGNLGYGSKQAIARVEVDAGFVTKEYDTNRAFTFVRDRDDSYGAARFFYRLAPKTSLVLEGRAVHFEYDRNAPGAPSLDSNVFRGLGGITWEATYKTTGFLKVGYIDKEFASGLRQDDNAVTWEVGIEWRPRTYSIVNIATSRDFQETNGAGDFIQHDMVSFNWNHAWLKRLSSVVDFSYAKDMFDPTAREDDLINAGISINYNIRRWLTIGAGYHYRDRDSSDSVFDFHRNIYELTARITL
ncbi:MAG: outer membrane beta-barrel protein [Gammaproteobacteria bacterium]